MLYQIDLWKSVPWDGAPAGRYAWSSTYYYDRDDFSTLRDMWLRAFSVDRIVTLSEVAYTKVVLKSPPGRANIVATIDAAPNVGFITGQGSDYNLLTVGRLLTDYADGRRSYRYWRAPLPDAWHAEGVLGATAWSWLQGYGNNLRAVSGFPASRNVYGSPMISFTAPRKVYGWQMRHGTLRRARTY